MGTKLLITALFFFSLASDAQEKNSAPLPYDISAQCYDDHSGESVVTMCEVKNDKGAYVVWTHHGNGRPLTAEVRAHLHSDPIGDALDPKAGKPEDHYTCSEIVPKTPGCEDSDDARPYLRGVEFCSRPTKDGEFRYRYSEGNRLGSWSTKWITPRHLYWMQKTLTRTVENSCKARPAPSTPAAPPAAAAKPAPSVEDTRNQTVSGQTSGPAQADEDLLTPATNPVVNAQELARSLRPVTPQLSQMVTAWFSGRGKSDTGWAVEVSYLRASLAAVPGRNPLMTPTEIVKKVWDDYVKERAGKPVIPFDAVMIPGAENGWHSSGMSHLLAIGPCQIEWQYLGAKGAYKISEHDARDLAKCTKALLEFSERNYQSTCGSDPNCYVYLWHKGSTRISTASWEPDSWATDHSRYWQEGQDLTQKVASLEALVHFLADTKIPTVNKLLTRGAEVLPDGTLNPNGYPYRRAFLAYLKKYQPPTIAAVSQDNPTDAIGPLSFQPK